MFQMKEPPSLLPSIPPWTYTRIDDLKSEDHDNLAAYSSQARYLDKLKRSWAAPQAPSCWTECYNYMDEDEDIEWTFQTDLVCSCLNSIKDSIKFVGDDVLVDRSPIGIHPSFRLSCVRHGWSPEPGLAIEAKYKTTATLTQVTDIIQYRGGSLAAEYAIAGALDGVPGTYVRRRNLKVQQPGDVDAEASHIDSAVLCVPVGPSSTTSVQNLLHLPISTLNPALVACVKGPASWADGSSSSSHDLATILCSMAETVMPSLNSLTANWHLRMLEQYCGDSSKDETEDMTQDLPEWAILIGIIYDSEVVHFVAHIPVPSDSKKQYHYLSVLFETLPFPEECHGDVAEFLLSRYKVAYAMLCLQHHIFRLESLWERTPGPSAGNEDEYDALWAQLVPESIDYTIEMPDPSHTSCDSAPLSLDFIIDEPEYGSNTLEAHAREIERVLPDVENWRNTVERRDSCCEIDWDS